MSAAEQQHSGTPPERHQPQTPTPLPRCVQPSEIPELEGRYLLHDD